jgi:hypothetical protein
MVDARIRDAPAIIATASANSGTGRVTMTASSPPPVEQLVGSPALRGRDDPGEQWAAAAADDETDERGASRTDERQQGADRHTKERAVEEHDHTRRHRQHDIADEQADAQQRSNHTAAAEGGGGIAQQRNLSCLHHQEGHEQERHQRRNRQPIVLHRLTPHPLNHQRHRRIDALNRGVSDRRRMIDGQRHRLMTGRSNHVR